MLIDIAVLLSRSDYLLNKSQGLTLGYGGTYGEHPISYAVAVPYQILVSAESEPLQLYLLYGFQRRKYLENRKTKSPSQSSFFRPQISKKCN